MKNILLLCCLLFAFVACDSVDKDGWLKGIDASYQYKLLTAKNAGINADFGDELYLSYTIYKGDSVLEQSPKEQYLIIPMPTREHRNAWENALMNTTVGDSIAVRAIFKTVVNSMHRFAEIFEREDWIYCHFKVHKIITRDAITAEQENIFFKTARFTSLQAMKAENKQIELDRDTLEKAMIAWTTDFSLGNKKELFEDEITNMQYEILPPLNNYELLNKNAIPKTGDTVIIHYMSMKLSDREIFDNSLARTTRFEFVVDKDTQYIKAFHAAVKRLAVGENAFFVMPSNLCYGEEGSPPIIPANTPLVFYVHLLGLISK